MKTIQISIWLALSMMISTLAFAHCQIPCGIYDDEARLKEIHEHITTIEKSIKSIEDLSDDKEPNYNQIVRWVNNKEAHAQEIQDIVQEYFLAQRIKPVKKSEEEAYAKYVRELKLLHSLIVHAMKAKQTTDMGHTQAMHQSLKRFQKSYLQKK